MDRLTTLLQLHEKDPHDADLLYMIGHEHYQSGRLEDARPWLERYAQVGQDTGRAWELVAECLLEEGCESAALEALQKGVAAALSSGHPTLAGELRARLSEIEAGEA